MDYQTKKYFFQFNPVLKISSFQTNKLKVKVLNYYCQYAYNDSDFHLQLVLYLGMSSILNLGYFCIFVCYNLHNKHNITRVLPGVEREHKTFHLGTFQEHFFFLVTIKYPNTLKNTSLGTLTPSARSIRTTPAPTPFAAPVINTTLFFKSYAILI